MNEVIIIGGGIMGCLTALNLLQAGVRVTMIERQRAGREASWAGGGIVSPLYPWRYTSEIHALAGWSQGYYPKLASQLLEQTGVDAQVTACGLMWLDHAEQEQALAWALGADQSLRQVDADFIYRQVPVLAAGYRSALWQDDLANVRNPRLLAALLARLSTDERFSLLEQCPASDLLLEGGRVAGVRTAAGEHHADAVVLAAGAWTGDWLAPLGIELPVQPVKGQMLLYRCEPGWLSSMVLFDGRYAIPRRDGHVLIGSTLEHSGYDASTTSEALASLRQSAEAMLPALARVRPVAQWAGLRPGSPEGVPFIGALPQLPGLWLNAGHYRNGLVLAPASCRLLVDLMLDREPIIDPLPYSPAHRLNNGF